MGGLQSEQIIAGRSVDNAGDMDIAGIREFLADAGAWLQAALSQCDIADMFRHAQRGVNSNNIRIIIVIVDLGQHPGQIACVDRISQGTIYDHFFSF